MKKNTRRSILSQPPEISLLIGTFLGPKELARAQEVNKAWYETFGQDSLWFPHLRSPISSSQRPLKVEVVYQSLAGECWRKGDLVAQQYENPHGDSIVVGGIVSPNGDWMLTFGDDSKVVLWRDFTPQLLPDHVLHHSKWIHSAMVSPDGNMAFTCAKEIIMWKGFRTFPITGTLITHPQLSGYDMNCTMSSDGKWALICGDDGQVKRWSEFDSPSSTVVTLAGKSVGIDPHQSTLIEFCSISPDGSWALIGGSCIIVLWRGFLSGNIFPTVFQRPHDTIVYDCVISKNGDWAMTVGTVGEIIKWTEFEKERPTWSVVGSSDYSHDILNLSLSWDETWSLASGYGRIILFGSHLESPTPQWTSYSHSTEISNTVVSSFGNWALVIPTNPLNPFTFLHPNVQLEEK